MTNPQKIQLTPWHGGECPCGKYALVILRTISGVLQLTSANTVNWKSCVFLGMEFSEFAVIETEIIEPPNSTIIPPEVWAVLPDWVTCAATDEDGDVFAYEKTPFIGGGSRWSVNTGDRFIKCNYLKGVIPAKFPWQDSLVRRPGCEPKL